MRLHVAKSIEEAGETWRHLERTGRFWAFQSKSLLSAWLATIGRAQGVCPRIVTLSDDAGPILLAPFGLRRRKGLAVLEFMGGLTSDYHAPLMALDTSARLQELRGSKLIRLLANQVPEADLVHLRHLPAKVQDLPNPLFTNAWPGREQTSCHLRLGAAEDYESFSRRLAGKSMRQDSNRQWRRLAEIGEPLFKVHEEREEQSKLIDRMIGFKRARYAETGVVDLLALPGFADFYRAFPSLDGPIHSHVSSLSVGGEMVAVHLGLVDASRFYYLMPAWQAGPWRRYSVGRLHMERLMAHCLEQGLQIFDFTIGGEEYKSRWAVDVMPLGECIQGVSISGRAAVLALRGLTTLRRIKR